MKLKDRNSLFVIEIAVVTLVVAIIGASYAFFEATIASNGSNVTGSTADIGVNLVVTPLSDGINNDMSLQSTDTIATAIVGTENGSCVDENENTVCKVYSILIENIGDSSLSIVASLTFSAESITNLKWGKGTSATAGFSSNSMYSMSETDLINPSTSGVQSTTLAAFDGVSGSGNDSVTYYVVVYIEDTGGIQADNGTFTGIVTVGGANGSISATFNS